MTFAFPLAHKVEFGRGSFEEVVENYIFLFTLPRCRDIQIAWNIEETPLPQDEFNIWFRIALIYMDSGKVVITWGWMRRNPKGKQK